MDPKYPQIGAQQSPPTGPPAQTTAYPQAVPAQVPQTMQGTGGLPPASTQQPMPTALVASPVNNTLEQAAAQARHISVATANNPYQKAYELERLRTTYLNATYGLSIKQPEQ